MGIIMGAISKEEKLRRVHSEAMLEFDSIQSALRDERLQCLKDRRFYSIAGAQWEGPLGDQFENKPKFEINKIHLAVIRIINEYRKNRITVKFVPKDGTKNDKLADTCADLYRADEQDSVAEEAFDNGFEEGVGGGIGAWRLCNEYEDEEDEENEKQRIRIKPIFDADSSVFFDLNAKRQDKSDAKRCYVISSMSHDEYEDEYGDDIASIEKQIHQSEFDWLTPDLIFIAEYYRKEKEKVNYHYFKGIEVNGEAEELVLTDEELEEEGRQEMLDATGFKKVKERQIKKTVVHKYILNGAKVIEDCGIIAGKHIPIVPVYGKRWFVDNIERCMGHVRLAKDNQMLMNMLVSKLGEISALSSVEKPIFAPEQMSGHSVMWAEDNVKNYPYLLANPLKDDNGQIVQTGPQAYTKPPQIPQATAALMQITDQNMRDLLGNQEAGEDLQNAVSGVAVELIHQRLDTQAYIYISNHAKAIKRTGQIWLSMAKDVYVEQGRKLKGVNASGEIGSIELLRPAVDKSGKQILENDLANAEFDVVVDVGPSSSSKRSAIVRRLIDMLPMVATDPETLQVLIAVIMENMEGEGMSDVREYFRKKLLKIGAAKPTEEEKAELAEELQGQQPDANTQYLQAEARKADALSQKAQADTVLAVAKAEETKANTVKTLADMDQNATTHLIDTVERLSNGQGLPEETPVM
jgi:hypothetical protein